MAKRFLIEILTFIVTFALSFKQVTFQNLLLNKICLLECNYTKLICRNLSSYINEEEQVQKIVNRYQLYISFITSIPNIICIMLLGPWSDRHGRKPLIIMSTVGFLLESFGILSNVLYIHASVKYLLLSAIPSGLFGGLICLVTATYSYISDISIDRKRTLKFIILEILVKFSFPIGTVSGGQVYQQLGYTGVFGISSVLFGIVLILAICLEESLDDNKQDTKQSFMKCCADIFNTRNIKNIIISFKKQSGRKQILLLTTSMLLGVTSAIGIEKIDYLYTKRLYGWDITSYSNQSSLFSIGSSLTMVFFSCVFVKVSSMQDALLGLLGSISVIIEYIFKAVATKPDIYYVASALGMLLGIISVATRSLISKLVDVNEHGTIFSLLAICEAFSPLFAGILFLEAYNATYDIFAGFVYCIGALLQIFSLAVFIWLLKRKTNNEGHSLVTSDSHSSFEEVHNEIIS